MNPFVLIDAPQIRKVELLEEIRWVEEFNARQLEKLADFLKAYSITSGTTILTEGNGNDFFCLLCAGKVAVMKEDGSGKTKEVQVLSSGKLFGEMSFFDHGPCSATIVAKEDATVLIMDKKSFASLTEEVPQIALKIAVNVIQGMSGRLRQTTGRLVDLI